VRDPVVLVHGLSVELAPGLSPVRGVDLSIARGECLGLVGESGSGKSMLALALLRLLPRGARLGGRVIFHGQDIAALPLEAMPALRGRRIGMIFQEPMAALNPLMRVGAQIAEPLRHHLGLSARAAAQRAEELLAQVGIPDPARRAAAWPHELSGGMRQRVTIAIALSCGPDLLIADEPTTALDATIQAQVVALLRRLKDELGLAMLLITHDLGVVAELADRVAVMYGGRIAEVAPAEAFFDRPLHPYARGLMAATAALDASPGARLASVPGVVPGLRDLPAGCAFHPRCAEARAECAARHPPEVTRPDGRRVACWALAEAVP